MTATAPFPDFFLPAPGEPAVPFKVWEQMFKNYCLVIDVDGLNWTEARQRALLLHCLGTEGQRIFYTLPETRATLAALHGYFMPKVNVVVERHTFRKRVQLADESIIQYVTALRRLVATCEFAICDDMMRDPLVEHFANPRIRERLLLKEKLTLEQATTIASQMESAGEQAKCMTSVKSSLPVHAVQVQGKGKSSHTGMHVRAHLQVILPPVTLLLQIPAQVFVVGPTSIWLMHRNAPRLQSCVKPATRRDILRVCVGLLNRLIACVKSKYRNILCYCCNSQSPQQNYIALGTFMLGNCKRQLNLQWIREPQCQFCQNA